MSSRLRASLCLVLAALSEGRGFGHNKQLYNHCVEISAHQQLYNRSIFPMTDIYNNLPQHVVDAVGMATFRSFLAHIARTRCQQQDGWTSCFDRRSNCDI